MRQRALVAALVVVSMGCAGSESPFAPTTEVASEVAAAGIQMTDYVADFEDLIHNECTGEPVFFVGQQSVTLKIIELKDGGRLTQQHIYVEAVGRGLDSHDSYEISQKNFFVNPLQKNGVAQTFVQHVVSTVTRNGSPTRMRFGVRAHLTVNPQGQTTVEWIRWFDC